MARAAEECRIFERKEKAHLLACRENLLQGIRALRHVHSNSPAEMCLTNTLNLRIDGREAEETLLFFAMQGLAISKGSACAAKDQDQNRILLAMGLSDHEARCSIRLSFGHANTLGEVDAVLAVLNKL